MKIWCKKFCALLYDFTWWLTGGICFIHMYQLSDVQHVNLDDLNLVKQDDTLLRFSIDREGFIEALSEEEAKKLLSYYLSKLLKLQEGQ